MIEIFAYAKINLFLDIQKKREDGYHDIISVMQTVDWCDKIYLRRNDEKKIHLTCSEPQLPTDEKNTAYKAAKLFLERIQSRDGWDIIIEKHIPHEAGMAGGSADAAATLKGLNRIYKEPLSERELLELGKQIGADVPFCIVGGTKLTMGIGEQMDPFPPMPDCFLVCAKMGEGISTPRAYMELDKRHADFKEYFPHTETLDILRRSFDAASLRGMTEGTYNIFEEVTAEKHPAVKMLKQRLREQGAIAAMMSGSGPSVFGVFEKRVDAERACEQLRELGAISKVCSPVHNI